MNKIIYQAVLIVFFSSMLFQAAAQDQRYTQSYANPLQLNPALMGANGDIKAILSYRNQWNAIDKGYTTYSFTFLYPLLLQEGKEKLDLGFNAINDQSGAYNNTNLSLAVGYNLKLSNFHNLSFSLLGGYVQKSLNTTKLTFDEQYVQGAYNAANLNSEGIANQKGSYADVGFGAIWYYNPTKEDVSSRLNAFAGVSAYHLNRPNESFIGNSAAVPLRINYQVGIKMIGEGKIDFTPNIRVSSQRGSQELAIGLYTDYHLTEKVKLILGTWVRKKDAVAFSLGMEHKNFLLGYSCDVITSDIRRYISGTNANEITIAYRFNLAERKNININPSPFSPF